MQSFSFKSDYDENQNIERIIKERNRKLIKQQIIFALLLFIIIALLIWYFARKVIYSEFDGYIQTEYMNYRAVDDIYLFDQYTDVGDIVIPGDTLYSYIYISNIMGIENLNSEPSVIINDRNIRLQSGIASSDVNVLRVRIRELENQIAAEDNNIRFGLTDNFHKTDLERQLAEAREQLKALLNKVGIYNNIRRETNSAVQRFGHFNSEALDAQSDAELLRRIYKENKSAVRYAVVTDTAVVTKLWAAPFSRVFKKESIIQLENVSLDESNMQVVAYVPTHAMGRINNNTRAEIVVNDDVTFTATVQLLGARTEELPEELRNSLSHTYTTVMVVFAPDRDQTLPLWAVVDHVPVRVRIKNFDNGRRNDGSDYWYVNREGLTEESKYHLGLLRQRRAARYHYNPADTAGTPLLTPEQLSGETAQPSGASAQAEARIIKHTVARGETLTGIAKRYEVTLRQIVELNPGVDKMLLAGAELRIPVGGDTGK